MLAYPSANRDEDVFDEPFRFDIRRDPNPHLAFGQGTHFCVGANLARLELRLLFGALTQRWTNLRVLTATGHRAEHLRRRRTPLRPRLRRCGDLRPAAPTRSATARGRTCSPTAGWGWSNAGLVTDGEASLLVDTLFDLALTATMLDELRAVSPRGRIDRHPREHPRQRRPLLREPARRRARRSSRPRPAPGRWTRCRPRRSPR